MTGRLIQVAFQAGLDSLGAVELRSAIAEQLGGIDLPETLVFDCPTPAAIVAFITAPQPASGTIFDSCTQ